MTYRTTLALALTLALGALARAGDPPAPPPRWFQREGAAPGVSATLWGPARPGAKQLVELTDRAVAVLAGDGQRAFVVLTSTAREAPALLPEGARLHAEGKEPQAPLGGAHPFGAPAREAPWRWVFAFPVAVLERDALRLEVPVRGGAPLVVELARLEREVAAARADVAAWVAHCARIAQVSAIQPYFAHPAARAFLARDPAVTTPLLLRELARTAPSGVGRPVADEVEPLPRFVVWEALVGTAWGKRLGLRPGGAPADVTAALRAWRGANAPRLAGVAEPQALVAPPPDGER